MDDRIQSQFLSFKMGIGFFFFIALCYLTNCQDYIESNNPVAAALLSKVGYTAKESPGEERIFAHDR